MEPTTIEELLLILKTRFDENMHRHPGQNFDEIIKKLDQTKLNSLLMMEQTGGEVDVVMISDRLYFIDCSYESPKGRRSLCFDEASLESRKQNKPQDSAKGMAKKMGIKLLDETMYRALQSYGFVDYKTSSWLETPTNMRKLGGGLFGDSRYETVFVYHNGVESYYAARGFRGYIEI